MCGGKGRRLWPISLYESKNFLNLFEVTPLEQTIRRFIPIVGRNNIYIGANKDERSRIKKLIERYNVPSHNVIFEPLSRNTAAVVLLALLKIKKIKNILITPIDHIIPSKSVFLRDLKRAYIFVEKGFVVAFGLEPHEINDNFGYIEPDIKRSLSKGVFRIKRFIEKPKRAKLKKLIREKNVLVNSGIFIAKRDILLYEFKKFYPHYKDFIKLGGRSLLHLYNNIDDLPFDKVVMEKTALGCVVRANFSWYDFGTWNSLKSILPKDKDGNFCKGDVFFYKAKNNLVYNKTKKKIVMLNSYNLVVIDTKDYLLVGRGEVLDRIKHIFSDLNGL